MSRDDRSIKGRPRLRLLAAVREREPNCWLCGGYIDQGLDAQTHPMGSTVDEVVPRSQGGDPLDPTMCRHAHRWCNSWRQARPVTPELRQALLTALAARERTLRPTSRHW